MVPDRSLTPEETLPTMAIRSAGNHTFVYRKMVEGPVGAAAPNHGDLVRVVDRDGQQLGYALWNGRSQISLRFLSRRAEPPGPEFWAGRIDEAVALRTSLLGLDRETDAYRVVHAEGDGLSGLIVDRFADVLSVEIFSLGMYQRIGPILSMLADRLGTAHFRVSVDERVALQEDFSGRPLASPQLPPRVTIQEHGIRYRIHFEECAQDRLLLRPARQPPRAGAVLRGPVGAGPLLLHRRLRAQRVDPRQGAGGHVRRPRREGRGPGARERQRQPGPARRGPRRRLRLHAPDGLERQDATA